MKKMYAIPVLCMTMASLILAACGAASSGSGFPTGRFIKSGSTDYGLLFNADGTFSVFQGDVTYIRGTYTVKGDVFTETSNDGGCSTNVEFNYTFDGTNLTFKYAGNAEDDADCSGRYGDFNNVTYIFSK